MAILAKDAYAAGATVITLVAVRLALAAPALWLAALAVRGPAELARSLRASRRHVAVALVVGAVPFAAQALMFFAAVDRLDAAIAELLVFTYPALVLLGGAALRRAPMRPETWGVLTLALSGAALVLLGGSSSGAMDSAGIALALGAAAGYAAYILGADGLTARLDGVVVAALMTTGGAASLTVIAMASGDLDLAMGTHAWLVLVVLALVCTAGPLVALYAGMRRVGAGTASVLSLVEPVVTVALAAVVLGERLQPGQVLGGLLVLSAVGVVLAGARGSAPCSNSTCTICPQGCATATA